MVKIVSCNVTKNISFHLGKKKFNFLGLNYIIYLVISGPLSQFPFLHLRLKLALEFSMSLAAYILH